MLSNPPTSGYTNFEELDTNDGSGDGEVKIKFLSYEETITESNPFTQVVLDRPGNAMALFGTQSKPSAAGDHSYLNGDLSLAGVQGGVKEGYVYSTERTYWFSEGYVNDVYVAGTAATGLTVSITYDVDATSNNGYVVIGGEYVEINDTLSDPNGTSNTNGVLNLSSSYYNNLTLTTAKSFYSAFVVDTTGKIKSVQTTSPNTKPLVAATDVVLGYASFSHFEY